MKMVLSGEPISAAEAKEYGILSALSEQGASQRDALDLAATIASKSQTAVALAKTAVKRGEFTCTTSFLIPHHFLIWANIFFFFILSG
jgi:enoyl-CoA hydratase/carnithine racemase